MTFRHGRNTFFSITDSGDTARDISTSLKDVSFPVTLDTPETTAFGSSVKTYVVGIKDGRFSCSGMFDATVDGYLAGIYGLETPRSFVYGPEGSTTGRVKYSGSVILTSYNISGSVSDMVAASLEFQVTGDITRGTFS